MTKGEATTFLVRVADRTTGEELTIAVQARSAEAAMDQAAADGWLVAGVQAQPQPAPLPASDQPGNDVLCDVLRSILAEVRLLRAEQEKLRESSLIKRPRDTVAMGVLLAMLAAFGLAAVLAVLTSIGLAMRGGI